MAENVVGNWRDFTFKMLTEQDIDQVSKFVRDNFLRHEPMNLLLGWDDGNAEDHDVLVLNTLKNGLSFGLYKKGTDELVALNLIMDGQAPDDGFAPTSDVCKLIMGTMDVANEVANKAFTENFDADNYAEIFITSVVSEFENQGIATEMCQRALKFLETKGFKTVKFGCSNPKTQKIGVKLGFSELGRYYYKSRVNEAGEQIFPTAEDDAFIQETAKKL